MALDFDIRLSTKLYIRYIKIQKLWYYPFTTALLAKKQIYRLHYGTAVLQQKRRGEKNSDMMYTRYLPNSNPPQKSGKNRKTERLKPHSSPQLPLQYHYCQSRNAVAEYVTAKPYPFPQSP